MDVTGMRPFRITSTYVEKTASRAPQSAVAEDHLHIRGENSWKHIWSSASSGSPPHTWRKRWIGACALGGFRITSTYVEKTS